MIKIKKRGGINNLREQSPLFLMLVPFTVFFLLFCAPRFIAARIARIYLRFYQINRILTTDTL